MSPQPARQAGARRTARRKLRASEPRPADATPFDRLDLYELCVQRPEALVPLLLGIHGGEARTLAEDFAGSAALSRHWVARSPKARAVAVDIDPVPLARAAGVPRLVARRADVLANLARPVAPRDRADIVFVGNFSIGEIHDRKRLVAYLRRARLRLRPAGVFVCDLYAGQSAFRTGAVQRVHATPDGRYRVRYTWQQRLADPLTGLVENALHFRVEHTGEIVQELTDAFVYRWRLWSVPELRDALREAGFARTEVFGQLPDALDSEGRYYARPITDPGELEDSFIVCIAGRV